MKKLNAKELGIGALAGLTAALLVYGATVQPLLFILFGALSALPILIVGLGWGNMAVIVAVVVAGIETHVENIAGGPHVGSQKIDILNDRVRIQRDLGRHGK